MSAVLLGGNRFVECRSILAYRGNPVLHVDVDPLHVELVTPENLPSHRAVRVSRQERSPEKDIRVVATSESLAIFWREYALVVATRFDADTAHLKLDLRPLGINIYDDFAGLHIGTNLFSGNEVSHAAVAINLGD
jgi:hypothetical protein